MLAIFNKNLVNPPQELNSCASLSSSSKKPVDILKDFESSSDPCSNSLSINFTNAALLAYCPPPPQNSYSVTAQSQRLFCGMDEIYCVFMGGLNNLCSLLKQYGLSNSKNNEAMFIIEAYRTLRDRGPYPAHQVLKDLEGSFGFVIYDNKAGHVFAALGENEGGGGVAVRLFWGIAADDGSVVISDKLEVVKGSCGKSYAPFPNGCMFHSELGLVSFQHPSSQMIPMARIDSEGILCGANFKADSSAAHSTTTMQRVGSEANWALWGSNAN